MRAARRAHLLERQVAQNIEKRRGCISYDGQRRATAHCPIALRTFMAGERASGAMGSAAPQLAPEELTPKVLSNDVD